ncbi:UNVERIFIED_CONTAM: hypothetical protein K2H54_044677 [Gekko kuhli]
MADYDNGSIPATTSKEELTPTTTATTMTVGGRPNQIEKILLIMDAVKHEVRALLPSGERGKGQDPLCDRAQVKVLIAQYRIGLNHQILEKVLNSTNTLTLAGWIQEVSDVDNRLNMIKMYTPKSARRHWGVKEKANALRLKSPCEIGT